MAIYLFLAEKLITCHRNTKSQNECSPKTLLMLETGLETLQLIYPKRCFIYVTSLFTNLQRTVGIILTIAYYEKLIQTKLS